MHQKIMPKRNFIDYLIITAKGIAMGAADAVPGVSGGTIAFITGIYEELITTLSGINLSLIKTLQKQGLAAFWKQLNGNFILALVAGITISFVSFMRIAKYLIENQAILIWSFFFGLIVASILYIGRQIKKWCFKTLLALILGGLIAHFITTIPPITNNEQPFFLFLVGAIAICAMILPGISGSFILLILGAYKTLSDAIHDFNLKNILIFVGGAFIGLISFRKLLKWLFKNYEDLTLAVLTGFIMGSLNVIWPWKQTITVFSKEKGLELFFNQISDLGTLSVFQKQNFDFNSYKSILEKSISPFTYSEINNGIDPQVLLSVVLMLLGFLIVFLLEKTATKKPRNGH